MHRKPFRFVQPCGGLTAVSSALLCALAAFVAVHSAAGQPLVPLEPEAHPPLLPTGILHDDVHFEGQLAYLWSEDEGTQVVHLVGGFRLEVGGRRLRAEQGVVWMTPLRYQDRGYRRFEVFLFRGAQAVEPAGTTTEGPLLFVTLSSFGEVTVSADKRTFASSSDTALYRDAAAVRDRVRAGLPGGEAPMTAPPVTVTPEQVQPPLPPPEFNFSADEISVTRLEDGGQVVSLRGRANLFRGATDGSPTLELLADAAVVFLAPSAGSAAPDLPRLGARSDAVAPFGGAGVEGVYLEGDIRLVLGERTLRASRVYYDLVRDRAILLDGVAFTMLPDRDLPLYVRAATIRQLSAKEYVADDAMLTTSEFHTPHYHVGAERLQLIDHSAEGLFGKRVGLTRAGYRIKDATFNLYNVPILYWPRVAGNVAVSDTSFRRLSVGQDGDFGVRVETRWDFFNLLSFEPPEGTSAELSLDYFSDRGPAIGLDVDYERDTSFGLLQAYGIDDDGEDNLGGRRRYDPEKTTRGRITWRHRQYLPEDWEVSFELSYISDRGFLEEFFESEFDEGKEQETLIYVKKQRANWALTGLLQWRLNDFFTQTERLPDFSFRIVGEPLGDFGSWYSENRAGFVRYLAADKELLILLNEGSDGPSSGATARIDSRQEVDFPFSLGPVRLVPFLVLRGSAWDETRSDRLAAWLLDDHGGGGKGRVFAMYGLRGSMYLSRVFPEVQSSLFDVNGLRHVIKPEIVAWASHGNRDSDELYPFDKSVEGIDDFDGVLVGVQQRLQTKRGAPDKLRVVDWITLDIELGLFNDGRSRDFTNGFVSYSRPENSVSRNFVNGSFSWRVSDATMLLGEMNYDLNDGELDIVDVGLQVDRSPRFSYGVDYRYIEETDSNLLGFGMNYKVDRKHTLAFRELFDLERGRTHDFTVAYIRKYPRWYVGLIFELDDVEDNAGVSLTVWPEGLPRAAIGTRRFTGLATSTALQPD